jgi:MoaA/NifB/PqqE/SkfB family radical SAM enzyme
MAFGPAFDSMMDPSRNGLVLTFILPAQKCNLRCPACIIRQRKEVQENILSIDNYLAFIESVQKKTDISHIAIQGYEPLLQETWPYTVAILDYAKQLNIASSLVTNGVYLDHYLNELSSLALEKLTVSLDAPDAYWHDLVRGVNGAFDATSNSLDKAAQNPNLINLLWVTSVLYPDKVHVLDGMSEFLEKKGVKHWAVSPLIKIGRDQKEGGVKFSYEELKDSISTLFKQASHSSIKFRIDDEFSLFHKKIPIVPFSAYRSVERVDNIIRLGPSGFCSIGRELLKTVSHNTLRWIPKNETASVFWKRIISSNRIIYERAA